MQDHLLGELPLRRPRRERRHGLRLLRRRHRDDLDRQLLRARHARRNQGHVLRRRRQHAPLRLRLRDEQPPRLVPDDAVGTGPHVRHHQHHRKLRHRLRRPVVLAVRHRRQARGGAQRLHARRHGLVHHSLRAGDCVWSRGDGAAITSRPGRSRVRARPSCGRDAHLRHERSAHDCDHAVHGHRLHGLRRVHRGVVDRRVRRVPDVRQPGSDGRRPSQSVALGHRSVRRRHGRSGGLFKLPRLESRLGVPLHGHPHRLGGDSAVEHDDLEGRLRERRRHCGVLGPGLGVGDVVDCGGHPVRAHHRRLFRHERSHVGRQRRRDLLVRLHPLRPLQAAPPELRLADHGRHQALR
mmetsp:Transcript_25770/g.79280  ORF Transcript_25770/g.79280 Transcript_25770/m.79280 type:complete len:352 (+) Transcript_25770:959-2014(+)